MTVIVGIAHKKKVWMGADSAATNSWGELSIISQPKIFTRGIIIFGVAGSARASNLLMYRFQPPEPQTNDVDEYMATDFIDTMRECFKQGGVAQEDNNVESVYAQILVGLMGNLYSIDGDFQVCKNAYGYDAIGTGGMIALGSLYSTKKRSPQARIQVALEAAQEYMASVRGPFVMGRV